jgi:hypothetical protein
MARKTEKVEKPKRSYTKRKNVSVEVTVEKPKYNWRKHLKSNQETVETILTPHGVCELEKVLDLGRTNMKTLKRSMKYMELNLFILEKIIENGKISVSIERN